ncbi:MAG: thioredoxin [candidate division KSB1 bacterium]|nr:thioredoxin [candidate division KSB1 bacterium]MDZ7275093.1 thioredoxin [candidate division KSB1 bacterium]MDZ7286459.1 thioredoxin [candidate division KSB1 bacterium]MDZ7299377.1 thioredoxin [candidate division KSB1 bacterium]MDZ7306294.1 thioredoxin [candidate division KSB1 bacterium]
MDVTYETFQKEVVAASHQTPVLVDFWAEWCGPCRILGPVLEKLAREAQGKWRLVKINTDREPELAQQFRIQGIPAVKLFFEGKVIAEFVGALPEREVRRWLEQNLPSAAKRELESARAALQSGDHTTARQRLESVLQSDPQNVEARVLLAGLWVATDLDKACQLVHDLPEGTPFSNKIEAIQTLHRLSHLPASGGEPAADWELYRRGIAAFRTGNYAGALEAWIELVGRNRRLDDDGARKACVAVFTLLGSEHPITQAYHRRFTSALY